MSISNLAIIIAVSIIGTTILSTVSSCLVLRYRRKKRSSQRAEAVGSDEKVYGGLIAVRGSSSPRFPRLGRGPISPADDFRLPSLSPLVQIKRAQREVRNTISFAASAYEENGNAKRATSDAEDKLSNADAVQPPIFRLQKNNGISSATAIRLIRVGSQKGKASTYTDTQQDMPLPRVVTASDPSQNTAFISIPSQPSIPYSLQTNPTMTQPTKVQRPPSKGQRTSIRSTSSSDTEIPSWRPPTRLTATGRDRFRFRDSSDIESSGPTPRDLDKIPPPDTNTPSPRTPRPAKAQGLANVWDPTITASPNQPKKTGGTFATFPRARNELTREGKAMMNRGRPNLSSPGSKLRGEEEMIRGKLAGIGDDDASNRIIVKSSRDISD